MSVSRQLLRRIYDATLGNALFALEVGRKLVDDGPPGIGEDLPVPDAVEDLLGLRVDRLPEAVRRLLLAVALSPDLRVGQLDTLADTETLDLAVASGVLVVDRRSRARLPSAARRGGRRSGRTPQSAASSTAGSQRPSATASSEHGTGTCRARPDASLAADVSAAAARANERGAPRPRSSSQITPSGSPRATTRIAASAFSGSPATSSSPARSSG